MTLPLFLEKAPITTPHRAARPVKPGLLVDAGFNGEIGPAKSKDERAPWGWCGEKREDGTFDVARGSGFRVLAWLAPGQECRQGDRVILDHAGLCRATNLFNMYSFSNTYGGGNFYAPIVGQFEESVTKTATMSPEDWEAEGAHRVYVKSMI